MFPSFTYPELQKKFCEGFIFYPFEALEQHGGYIYKRYAQKDNTQQVLDRYREEYDFNNLHAQQLIEKLQQKDIPVGGELLYHLQRTGCRLEGRFYSIKKRPPVYRQLLDVLENYHKALAVFQHKIQQPLVIQLGSMAGLLQTEGSEGGFRGVTEDNLVELQATVHEFLTSSDTIIGFLTGCIEKEGIYRKLALSTAEEVTLKDTVGLITSFKRQQRETYYMLRNWQRQLSHFREQCTMN